MESITVKPLKNSQIPIYLDMLIERAKWLEKIKQPMWNMENLNPINFGKMYPNYKPYLIYKNEDVIGGFILLNKDDFLWTEEENMEKAFYLHKLVIKEEFSGKGYAEKSLELIKKIALESTMKYLRLDCYYDRCYLRHLYEKCGFYKKRKTVMEDGTGLQSYELLL
jgi:RimJ/RimL family protein N-acetyltransferase